LRRLIDTGLRVEAMVWYGMVYIQAVCILWAASTLPRNNGMLAIGLTAGLCRGLNNWKCGGNSGREGLYLIYGRKAQATAVRIWFCGFVVLWFCPQKMDKLGEGGYPEMSQFMLFEPL